MIALVTCNFSDGFCECLKCWCRIKIVSFLSSKLSPRRFALRRGSSRSPWLVMFVDPEPLPHWPHFLFTAYQFCHIIKVCLNGKPLSPDSPPGAKAGIKFRLPAHWAAKNVLQWAATYNQRWKSIADQDVGKSMLNSHCPAGGSGCARLLQCRCDGIGSARDPVGGWT